VWWGNPTPRAEGGGTSGDSGAAATEWGAMVALVGPSHVLIVLAASLAATYLKKHAFKVRVQTWPEMGLADIARHVIGSHSTQKTRVINACQ
jgi:hypothetical protein